MLIDDKLKINDFENVLNRFFAVSAKKLDSIFTSWKPENGTPVFTVDGQYTAKGWTEWTQGFMFGWSILQYEATGDVNFLKRGQEGVLQYMAPHISHIGVHDHGFNNISTYGNLRRLMLEGGISHDPWELRYYELALKLSGAVQAGRWSMLADGTGYIYSFNGPHSLFIDTIRSLRSLMLSYQLGHIFMGEGDRPISLLERIIHHSLNTAKYNIYYDEARDAYEVRGRVAHESIFNMNSGEYRCPNSQQGYSPFSTWTRGLAWAILGYAELLEFFTSLSEEELKPWGGYQEVSVHVLKAATATADFYINNTALDGIPYWDTGAPGLESLGDWKQKPADPYNNYEPVDSSAAAIAAQGLARLGSLLKQQGDSRGQVYFQAALTTARTLFNSPYLSESDDHQGLLLHSIYHRPNGWDHIPNNSAIPYGESSMWGDYHAIELALYLKKIKEDKKE